MKPSDAPPFISKLGDNEYQVQTRTCIILFIRNTVCVSFTACEQPSNFLNPSESSETKLIRNIKSPDKLTSTSPLKSRAAGIVSAWCLVLPELSTCCPLGCLITTEGERHHDWVVTCDWSHCVANVIYKPNHTKNQLEGLVVFHFSCQQIYS